MFINYTDILVFSALKLLSCHLVSSLNLGYMVVMKYRLLHVTVRHSTHQIFAL